MRIKFSYPSSFDVFIFYFECPALIFNTFCNLKISFNSIFRNFYKRIIIYNSYIC